MELITATQGFASARSGLRTRSFGSGGSLGAAEVAAAERASWAGFVLPATILKEIQCKIVVKLFSKEGSHKILERVLSASGIGSERLSKRQSFVVLVIFKFDATSHRQNKNIVFSPQYNNNTADRYGGAYAYSDIMATKHTSRNTTNRNRTHNSIHNLTQRIHHEMGTSMGLHRHGATGAR
jgi:hypothetical protein